MTRARLWRWGVGAVVIIIAAGALLLVRVHPWGPTWLTKTTCHAAALHDGTLIVATDDSTRAHQEVPIDPMVLQRLSRDGSLTVLVHDLVDVRSVVATSSHVFWTQKSVIGHGTLKSAPIGGGEATIVAESDHIGRLAAVDDRAYWIDTDKGALMRSTASTPGPIRAPGVVDARCVAADEKRTVVATPNRVFAVLPTGEVEPILDTQIERCDIAIASGRIFLATWSEGNEEGSIGEITPETKSLQMLSDRLGSTITVRATSHGIYWEASHQKRHQLQEMPFGGKPRLIVEDDVSWFDVDETGIYFLTEGTLGLERIGSP